MVELVSPAHPEPVIAYRCSWIDSTGFLPFHRIKPKPDHQDFDTKEEAMAWQAALLRRPGREITATVTPIRLRAKVSARTASRAALDAAGWPVQKRK